MIRRRHLPLLAALPAAPALAQGERYPNRTITFIVPYPPGGSSDNSARPVAQKLGEVLGQSVVIENRGGAGGSLGAAVVAGAKPDGYTLAGVPDRGADHQPAHDGLALRSARAFAPVSMLAFGDGVVAMHPSVPARSIPELIAHAKASPTPLRFGSAGNGTITQMTGELFAEAAGIRLEHVPYRGSAPALTDLLAGRVHLQFDPIAIPAIKDGRLIGLAISGDQRSAELPQLPTLKELGLAGDQGLSFHGLAAPAGVPAEVMERLTAALKQVLAMPEVARAMAPVGLRPNFEAGEAFAERLRRDREVFGAAVRGRARGRSDGDGAAQQVKVWDEGPVRVVAIDRPDKGNAINRAVAEQIQAAMRDFDRSDSRVAVLTGTGTKAFSVGADVSDVPELWRAVPNVGWQTDKPLIAAVEGWCVGGALVLAMMADLAVCGAGAKFYYPEAKLGLTGGMIAALPSRIPHKIAMELMLLCRTFEAERAAAVGLVNEVVPEGEALSARGGVGARVGGLRAAGARRDQAHGGGRDPAARTFGALGAARRAAGGDTQFGRFRGGRGGVPGAAGAGVPGAVTTGAARPVAGAGVRRGAHSDKSPAPASRAREAVAAAVPAARRSRIRIVNPPATPARGERERVRWRCRRPAWHVRTNARSPRGGDVNAAKLVLVPAEAVRTNRRPEARRGRGGARSHDAPLCADRRRR